MKTSLLLGWNLFHIIKKALGTTTKGAARYPLGQNLKRLQVHYESAIDWIKNDKIDFKWDGDFAPSDADFQSRFDAFLKDERIEFEPYRFKDSVMEFVDGINADEEALISILFIGNEPDKQPTTVDEDAKSTSS